MAGLLMALLLMSSSAKLMGSEELVTNFTKWDLIDWIVVIGIGELISGILFLIPRTSSLGLLLLSAHFGGAIATHMGNNEPFIPIAGILVFIWVTALVRDPDTLSSFRK
ncbi:MAG: DoxX family protein [Flammeovirgaceae bacterium]|nr:DoxX family protein [Flammeovirgaceae bacterium]